MGECLFQNNHSYTNVFTKFYRSMDVFSGKDDETLLFTPIFKFPHEYFDLKRFNDDILIPKYNHIMTILILNLSSRKETCKILRAFQSILLTIKGVPEVQVKTHIIFICLLIPIQDLQIILV